MPFYTTSQKLKIIKEIDHDSREIWLTLQDDANHYGKQEITDLFVDILSRDSSSYNRFDYKASILYIEEGLKNVNTDTSIELLVACVNLTSQRKLSHFLLR